MLLRYRKLDRHRDRRLPAGQRLGGAGQERHAVLGTPLTGPWPEGAQVAVIGMGCFWGAERMFWRLPCVISTVAGYAGGITPNPTYEEVCSGRTGHTEVVQVVYDPMKITDAQLAAAQASREAFQPVGVAAGHGEITTEVGKLEMFYYAEDYHQQYLEKYPGRLLQYRIKRADLPGWCGRRR